MAEIALQYNDSYNELLLSFANNIHTPEGGMHETGFKTALTRVLNDYGKKNNFLKNEEKLSGEDCREGLAAIISVKLTEAQFEGQTKAKLGNSEMRTLVDNVCHRQADRIPGKEPSRCPDRPGQGDDSFPRQGSGPEGPGEHPAQKRPGGHGAPRQAGRLQRERPGPHRGFISSRATRPAAAPRAAGTAGSRRSSPCGGRCSMWKKPGLTRFTAMKS